MQWKSDGAFEEGACGAVLGDRGKRVVHVRGNFMLCLSIDMAFDNPCHSSSGREAERMIIS
jgi:hypothetical protein